MAKNVTNPNQVPNDGANPNFQGDMSAETLALLRKTEEELNPETPEVEVVTSRKPIVGTGHPTRQEPVYNSKGKQTGWVTVLDKGQDFLQPGHAMRKAAHHATIKGQTGKVLILGESGVVLARFANRPLAETYCKACGIDLQKLLDKTAKDPKRKVIRNVVPTKEDTIAA